MVTPLTPNPNPAAAKRTPTPRVSTTANTTSRDSNLSDGPAPRRSTRGADELPCHPVKPKKKNTIGLVPPSIWGIGEGQPTTGDVTTA